MSLVIGYNPSNEPMLRILRFFLQTTKLSADKPGKLSFTAGFSGPLSKSTKAIEFQNKFPERFVEAGISEASAMSIAMGLASEGQIPFYVNFAIFVFHPDDKSLIREKEYDTVRDNVILELGMFIGTLGLEKCFILKFCY